MTFETHILCGSRDVISVHSFPSSIVRCTRPSSVADFRAALTTALEGDRTTIIEITTDRRENLELHRRVNAAVAGD